MIQKFGYLIFRHAQLVKAYCFGWRINVNGLHTLDQNAKARRPRWRVEEARWHVRPTDDDDDDDDDDDHDDDDDDDDNDDHGGDDDDDDENREWEVYKSSSMVVQSKNPKQKQENQANTLILQWKVQHISQACQKININKHPKGPLEAREPGAFPTTATTVPCPSRSGGAQCWTIPQKQHTTGPDAGGSIHGGTQNGGFIRENPIKMDDK